jgi:hypothetical protein
VGRWDEMGAWTGDGLRREAFFFRSGGTDLFGSLYAAEPLTSGLGVAICNSWGVEADQASRVVHPLALEVARGGGAGLIFHYPGFGDSGGAPEEATMEAMAGAAVAAVREGERRLPGSSWILAGLALGASVACMALEEARPEALLLAQPALRPSEYFGGLTGRARRVAGLSPSGTDTLFGYPASEALLRSAARADEAVASALGRCEQPGAVVRYSSPEGTDEVPDRFERISIDGTWHFAARDNSKLGRGAAKWLTDYMKSWA